MPEAYERVLLTVFLRELNEAVVHEETFQATFPTHRAELQVGFILIVDI